jgi:N,N'-diacetyllegionaminate synthase
MNEPTNRATVIAEAAQGFEGDPRLARLLVRAAVAGHADVVKFQLVFADELATREYQHYDLFRRLEMPDDAWQAVAADAAAAGLGLAFDVFGMRSLDLALRLGSSGVKLHATDFFNRSLVRAAFSRAPHVYLSLGGIEYDDIAALLNEAAVDRTRLTLMFGFQGEPTTIDQNHLARLAALSARFPAANIGFMDHSDGAADEAGWLGALALAFGASVIEKHITIDRALQLEDWVSALDPTAFARYVSRIRVAARALGNTALELTDAERDYGRRAVKAVVAARPIEGGAVVQRDDVVALRAPMPEGRTVLKQTESAVGRTARHALAAGQPVCAEDLE